MELNENSDLDSGQVEDLRGSDGGGGGVFPGAAGSGGGGALGGLIGGLLPMLFGRSKGLGCAVVILIVICVGAVLLFGGNLGSIAGLGGGKPADNTSIEKKCARNNPDRFTDTDCVNLAFVNSIQAYWKRGLPENFSRPYESATTRFFSGQVSTACGAADSGVGPFYCPGDRHVYIDLTFWDELAKRFGAPGQFAQAYVLAHEYGHHVQTLLGTEAQMRRAQQRDPGNANKYSVMLELQADCYSGVWSKHATETTDAQGTAIFKSLTQDDINQALRAATAVGDDAIQKKMGGQVNESKFTHGSSEQRRQWFNQGYGTGDPKQCNTFGGALGQG